MKNHCCVDLVPGEAGCVASGANPLESRPRRQRPGHRRTMYAFEHQASPQLKMLACTEFRTRRYGRGMVRARYRGSVNSRQRASASRARVAKLTSVPGVMDLAVSHDDDGQQATSAAPVSRDKRVSTALRHGACTQPADRACGTHPPAHTRACATAAARTRIRGTFTQPLM